MKWTWKSGFLYAISLQISSACFYCFLIWINSDHSPEKRTWGRNRINADCFESYKTYQAENDRYTVYPWYTSLFIPLLSISLDLECRCFKLQVFQISGVSNCRCCKLHMLQIAGVANCTCCKVYVMQIACVANCTSCKLYVLRIAPVANCL